MIPTRTASAELDELVDEEDDEVAVLVPDSEDPLLVLPDSEVPVAEAAEPVEAEEPDPAAVDSAGVPVDVK